MTQSEITQMLRLLDKLGFNDLGPDPEIPGTTEMIGMELKELNKTAIRIAEALEAIIIEIAVH